MDKTEFAILASKWNKEVGITINHCPPEAKVITGAQLTDARLHYFQQESGTKITYGVPNKTSYTGYDIVDEKKYAWFLLRWM